MKRKSSRRDFLTGRAAADAMADSVDGALPDGDRQGPPNRSTAGPSYLVHVARRAMACEFEVCFNAGQHEHDTQTALEALDLVEALEDQMSVFRQKSEICHINRTAAHQPVEVEPRLFELLELAMRLHGETEGAFDLTAGPLWSVWGFARRAGAIPAEGQLAEALQYVGSHLVELDRRRKTVRFSRQGVQLNLGSIGKGYALDRCAEAMHRAGIADFLIHGGHSSMLARGSRRGTPDQRADAPSGGWVVGLRHPLRGDRRLAEIRLRDRALATSGSRAQSFVHAGRRYGHILDPRSGQPAKGLLSATVIAPSAALADALSTAFYVMGPQPALDYCRDRPGIAAVLVCPVRHSGGFEIRRAGLAEDEMRLL
ncbi:MAG: FAD:protein FMN transferase [Planctomycetota bacterium]|jgi:thiamine biosynthesis lipoprotein